MKISEWAENICVSIVGAVEHVSCIKGRTTTREPFREGMITKAEVIGDDGKVRNAAISRIRINGEL